MWTIEPIASEGACWILTDTSLELPLFTNCFFFQALKMKFSQQLLDEEDEDIFENDFDFFGDSPAGEADYREYDMDYPNRINSPFLSVKFEDFYDKLQVKMSSFHIPTMIFLPLNPGATSIGRENFNTLKSTPK